MEYYVDGYNLLFKEARVYSAGTLEESRKKLIEELDKLADIGKISLTVVFDAPFQSDDLKRGHYNSLEIIFTAKGQTADEYLELVAIHKGKRACIVTNDKGLAYKAKAAQAFVENVHTFILHLRKKCRNKIAKSHKQPLRQQLQSTPDVKKTERKPIVVDMNNLPPLSDLEAWEEIFTSRPLL